jgi:hypothetical protein
VYVGGDPPPVLIDILIDTDWLAVEEAADPRAIFRAMCSALLSIQKNVDAPTQLDHSAQLHRTNRAPFSRRCCTRICTPAMPVPPGQL